MPSSSPYQENNYQALSTFRPYSLPVNDIAKAISAQNQFWWDGASKVKQQYQNALDLDLTLDENKTIRDNFLKEAEKQMTKLSAGNVADPSVQRQGLSIFKPLFKDRGILLDDQLTKKRQAIFSDAERFKNDEKTKGAGYNNDNLAYALRPFQGFGQTTSRADLEGVWGKAKDSQYTPYYDVSKERLDILKACKPTKASGTQVDDAYLRTSEVNSLSSQKLYGCLEGNMSGQAMQQLHISGVVRYGDNYQAVKDDYLAAAKDKHTQYSSEQAELLARKAALQKQAGTEDQVKDIDAQLKQYDDAIGHLDDDLTNIGKWTPEYIQSNYEDLASTAFFRKANGSFAQAFAYKDIEESVKANPIWISNFVQGKLDERQQKEFVHDEQMQRDKEAADLQKALLTGKTKDGKEVSLLDRLKNPESLSTFPTAALDDPNTPNTQLLKQQINSYDQNWKESVNTLMHHMYQVPGIKDAMDKLGIDVNKDRTQEQWTGFMRTLDTYVASHPDPTDDTKQEIIKAKNILTQYRNKKAQLQTVLDDATTQAKTKNPEIFQNEQEAKQKLYGSLTPLQFGNETLSPDRLRNIFEGKDARYEVGSYDSSLGAAGFGGGTIYTIKDKVTGQAIPNKYVGEYMKIQNEKSTNFSSAVDKELGDHTVLQRMGISAGNIFTEANPWATDYLQTAFGQRLGVINTKPNTAPSKGEVVFSNTGPIDPITGKVRLQAVDKDGPVSAKRMREAIAAAGGGAAPGNSMYGAQDIDNNTLEVTVPALSGAVTAPSYKETLTSLLNYQEKNLQSHPSQGVQMRLGWDVDGREYSVKSIKAIDGGMEYLLMVNGEVGLRSKNRDMIITKASQVLDNVKMNLP